MTLARFLAVSTVALSAALRCKVSGYGANSTLAIPVGNFTRLVISSGLQAHVRVVEEDSTSVAISGFSNLLPRVVSFEPLGELLLGLVPKTCNPNLVVNISVPRPLTSLSALSGAHVIVDSMGGSVTATAYASVVIEDFIAPPPVYITISEMANISVTAGNLSFLRVASATGARVSLGALQVENAEIAAATRSSLMGMTVKRARISLATGARVALTATEQATYSCGTGAELNISGGAEVTKNYSSECRVNITPARDARFVVFP